MKRHIFKLLILLIVGVAAASCSATLKVHSKHHHHHSDKPLPPGQAKKMTGEKSAKHHAPGHNKH